MGFAGLESVPDGKLRKITTCRLPFLRHIADMGGWWAPAAPGEQLLKLFRFTFGHDLYAAVLRIAHPADQPHRSGGLLRVHSEEDTLDIAGNGEMESLHICEVYLHDVDASTMRAGGIR